MRTTRELSGRTSRNFTTALRFADAVVKFRLERPDNSRVMLTLVVHLAR